MNYKKIKIIPLFFFLTLLITIFIVPFFEFSGLCISKISCEIFSRDYADPLAIITLALFLSSMVLLFSKNNYTHWVKLTLVWIVIVFLVFILSPTEPSGASVPLDPVRDEAVLYVSIPYILISWSIALWGFVKERKK